MLIINNTLAKYSRPPDSEVGTRRWDARNMVIARLLCSWSPMVYNDWTLGDYQPLTFYATASWKSMPASAWSMMKSQSPFPSWRMWHWHLRPSRKGPIPGKAEKAKGDGEGLPRTPCSPLEASLLCCPGVPTSSSSSLMGKVNSPHACQLGFFHKSIPG